MRQAGGLRSMLRAAAAAALMACGAGDDPAEPVFVGSAACGECHADALRAWTGSQHDRAMQRATPETVLGDFDDARFASFPVVTRFFTRNGRFFVHTEGPDGALGDFEVQYTFGVKPLQQYLIALPGGRLQCLTVAWDTERERWFDLYPGERIAPPDPLHWTGRYQRWNAMCADCHSTGLRRGYAVETDSYRTTWEAIDVACEACHGPGSAHAAWARRPEPRPPDPGLPVDFEAIGARGEVETCARCHARRHAVSAEPDVSRPLLDDFVPELLREDLYHADGQIEAEVYVYGSFVQSRMYRRGVRCSDCHEPHGLGLRAAGDALCTRCHQEQPDPRFPTLARRRYDAPSHHFHPSPAPGCVDCHMPSRTYMQVDARRDHSLRVPRPDLSLRIGTPNACNGCHADRSVAWAVDAVTRWYGPDRRGGAHFGEAIAAGRAAAPGAEPALVALARDGAEPSIARATALDLLARRGEGLEIRRLATRDPDPLVRATAVGGFDRLDPALRAAAAAPLLGDPIRAVRIEAARVLSSVAPGALDLAQQRALDAALSEFEAAQRATADLPAAHLNLAVLYENRGRTDLAEAAYRTALRWDPGFLPASLNLAHLYNRTGRNPEAEAVLREALAQAPEEGELHYSLGLLLAESGRLAEAAEALARASERMPGFARVRTNRGLALLRLGRVGEAEAALLEAESLDPGDPDPVQALAVLFAQRGDWARALPHARRLVELAPGAPGPQNLLERIESELE
jgi:predicted CXXCH cytochrome family protein